VRVFAVLLTLWQREIYKRMALFDTNLAVKPTSFLIHLPLFKPSARVEENKTRMWANAQRDGRPAEYRWRPLFNARKVWLTPAATTVPCSSAAKTQNPLKLVGVPKLVNLSQPLVGRS